MSDSFPAHPLDPPAARLLVFRDPALDGPTNMARDEQLLHDDAVRTAAVRIYQWSHPTISLGYFQRFDMVAELPDELRGLPVVRRLTGGGAILHDREITYCLVADASIHVARRSPAELYRLAHACWRDAIAEGGGPRSELAPDEWPLPSPRSGPFFCFARAGRTDLTLGEGKLLGSAQRRIPGRVLQHGSLLLGRRFSGHPGAHLGDPPPDRVRAWIEGFLERLAGGLGLPRCESTWTERQLAGAEARRLRYAGDEWTRRR